MSASNSIAALQDTDSTELDHALEVGLSSEEFARCQEILGRVPNKVELGCFSAMWSEHCSYKSSRLHLGRLPSTGPRVVQGPGENAGVIDVGDGWGVCFKVESHNHPSFIEPYQGAATGVGGILRDIFTMGARPIAAANLLRFGQADHAKTPHLVSGVVKGIGDYGNCFGVPTVWTDVAFDSSYNGNILVNAFALGVVRNDGIFLGRAEGVGNPVMYAGAKTGRDGIHGATMASDSFSEGEEAARPTVQVGDPFKEKLLLEACLECFQTDALVGIQDMGAAGLTSSSFEMASRTGAGLRMDLDAIPARETGMTAYEKMLSESQERMLLVAQRGREDEVREIFARWDLDAVQVGEVTDDGMVRLVSHGAEIAVMPARELADEAPKYDRPHQAPKASPAARPVEKLGRWTTNPDVTARRWVYEQFDREVLIGTLSDGARAAAAVVEIPQTERAVAIAMVCDQAGCGEDPFEGARRTVFEGALRVSAVGGEAAGASDCLNYGNPEVPEVMHTLVRGIDGITDACKALAIPVVSGNVSLYNETDGRSVLPTPTVAIIGVLDDATKRTDMCAAAGSKLIVLGGEQSGQWDSADVKKLCETVRGLVRAGKVAAARPCARGGLGMALVEMAVVSGQGVDVELDVDAGSLCGEDRPRVLLAVDPEHTGAVLSAAVGLGEVRLIGDVGGERVRVVADDDSLDEPLADVVQRWEGALPRVVGAS